MQKKKNNNSMAQHCQNHHQEPVFDWAKKMGRDMQPYYIQHSNTIKSNNAQLQDYWQTVLTSMPVAMLIA